MDADQLGREVQALRQAVVKAETDAREARALVVDVMDLMRLLTRSTANHQHQLTARMDAALAVLRGDDPQVAYMRVRDRFKAGAPRLYEAALWGDRPDWLADILRQSARTPANEEGPGSPQP